jgi:hypothetical protein
MRSSTPSRSPSTHTIEIDSFVPRAQIDERFFDTPYYITPNEQVGQEALRLSVRPCAASHSALPAERRDVDLQAAQPHDAARLARAVSRLSIGTVAAGGHGAPRFH